VHRCELPFYWQDDVDGCNFQGINSTVEIAWTMFRILAGYRLRHLVNKLVIHIYTHDYIRMEITVLYLKISRHQLSISWSQISVYWLRYRITNSKNISWYFNRGIDTMKITALSNHKPGILNNYIIIYNRHLKILPLVIA
jgi:hypothetical protein